MIPVVIVGTGGHAREVAEIVQLMHAQGTGGTLAGFVTDNQSLHGTTFKGLPIFGHSGWLLDHPEFAAIIAIGDNPTRQRIAQQLQGCQFASAISPYAVISASTHIAHGAMIFPNTFISCDTVIGAHTIVNVGASISHDSSIGEFCNINPGARIAGNCRLEKGVSLGMTASVIQGRTIGAWSIVGAGAAVVRDLPSNVTAVGVPAKIRT